MKITVRKLFFIVIIFCSIVFCYAVLSTKSSILPVHSTLVSQSEIFGQKSSLSEAQQDEKDKQIVDNVESPVSENQDKDSYQSASKEISESPKEPQEVRKTSKPKKLKKNRQKEQNQAFVNIPCNINDEYRIDCLKNQQNSSVYIPFNFIKKYFEVNGKIVRNSKGLELFDWSHSYSKLFYPDEQYSPFGKYLWFENYNVELRERVLCLSASEGVPISTQWFPKGHFYPTQIAQFGLSHFNKNLTEPAPKRIILFQNSKFSNRVQLLNDDKNDASDYKNNDDQEETEQKKDNFEVTPDKPLRMNLNKASYNHLICDFELQPLAHFNLTFEFRDISEESPAQYSLVYSTLIDTPFIKVPLSTSSLSVSSSSASTPSEIPVYGLGTSILKNSSSFRFTRDLLIDLTKAGQTLARKRSNFTVTKIIISGSVKLHSLALLTSAHGRFAEIAGEWFVKNQNEAGGWEIKVRRKLQKNKSGILILEPGWHSAMAQGQAISLLIRLYQKTRNELYLESAKKALNLFEVDSIQRGVRAMLFGKYVWFEEYPTVPSIFVLNGFIYSLFGLYDLSKTCEDMHCQKAETLFQDGVHSLEQALLLFDSGSGSFYDLRHLALGSAPNVARWDYHSTHINQLLQLNTIARRDLFENTVERWTQYMKGKRAPHN